MFGHIVLSGLSRTDEYHEELHLSEELSEKILYAQQRSPRHSKQQLNTFSINRIVKSLKWHLKDFHGNKLLLSDLSLLR